MLGDTSMLPSAPLPEWADFRALFGGPVLDDRALAAPWTGPDGHPAWFSRGAWALRHLVDGRPEWRHGAAATVWLPDYFCNQATQPMRDGGARLEFYPVDLRLRPDWARGY